MKVTIQAHHFPPMPTSINTPNTLESGQTKAAKVDDPANLASGEESSSDMAGPSSLGPIRGRLPHLQIRTTPYERSEESSSRSPSLHKKHSLGTLSLLQIPHAYLSPVVAPSPLNQVTFSHPNSPSPTSDNEMNVDESNLTSDEGEVLAKASIVIIPLPHLHTTPPTQLLACTTCQCGVNPSSVLTHSKGHRINLLSAEKKAIQSIISNSSFLDDSIEVDSPTPPCPPIEGILVRDGLSCKLCSYCCVTYNTIKSHFNDKHRFVPGFAKANSKSASVQALFARRPKYFAVMPSLCGLNEDDLFSVYLQQCAPEIEALKILPPPLNANEVPPLLKVTEWHEHLKDYTNDRDSVQKLLELTKLPTSRQGIAWLGLPLRSTIEGYLRDVRNKARNASLGIKCLLKECPRFVNSLFIELGINFD